MKEIGKRIAAVLGAAVVVSSLAASSAWADGASFRGNVDMDGVVGENSFGIEREVTVDQDAPINVSTNFKIEGDMGVTGDGAEANGRMILVVIYD